MKGPSSDAGLNPQPIQLLLRVPPYGRAPVVEVAKVAADVACPEVVAVKVDVAVLAEAKAADLLEAPRLGATVLSRLLGVAAANHLVVARQADGGGVVLRCDDDGKEAGEVVHEADTNRRRRTFEAETGRPRPPRPIRENDGSGLVGQIAEAVHDGRVEGLFAKLPLPGASAEDGLLVKLAARRKRKDELRGVGAEGFERDSVA